MSAVAKRPAREWLLDTFTVVGVVAVAFAVATSTGTLPPWPLLAGTLIRTYAICTAAVVIGTALSLARQGWWLARTTGRFPRGLFFGNLGAALMATGYLINIIVLLETYVSPRWYGAPFASLAFTVMLYGYYWVVKRERFGRF